MGQSPSNPSTSVTSDPENQTIRDVINHSPINTPEEPAPPYEPVYNELEWNAWAREEKDEDSTFHQNPFVYGGAIPANPKPKNVILFGETGVGKSSVINLMAGGEVAATSSNLQGCTLEMTEHSFLLDGRIPFRIYDTVGLNEPEMSVSNFFNAIEKAHQLIKSLHDRGGVDLLLFCIRGNRITTTVQRNYRLFFEILGEKKIPLAFVVTNLENEAGIMENWWERNEQAFQDYGIASAAHACITAVPSRVTMFREKREWSRHALQQMLHKALSAPRLAYKNEVLGWFSRVIEFLRSLLKKTSWFKKMELLEKLESRCGFSREEAQRLAETLI